jgi:hypothetical protein
MSGGMPSGLTTMQGWLHKFYLQRASFLVQLHSSAAAPNQSFKGTAHCGARSKRHCIMLCPRPAVGAPLTQALGPMKLSCVLVAIGCLAASLNCGAGESASPLKGIAEHLASAHMAPQGQDWNFRCPKRRDQLLGLTQDSVAASLGKPDFVGTNKSRGTSWTYYFSSTPPANWQPRYPRLTFYFSAQRQVQRATCFDLG